MTLSRKTIAVGSVPAAALLLGFGYAALSSDQVGRALPTVVVQAPANGSCCRAWAAGLRDAGYDVRVTETREPDRTRRELGVPPLVYACHTATVDGYVLEGHVPARDIGRLLRNRPGLRGLGVAGMPPGAPGMSGEPVNYDVVAFRADGWLSTISRYGPDLGV